MLSSEVYVACKEGDFEKLKSIINTGYINDTEDGYTLLHNACIRKHEEIAKWLVKRGADVTRETSDGGRLTPLHLACITGCAELADFLISNGADTDAESTLGCTPLHYASYSGCLATVKVIINNINIPPANGSDKSSCQLGICINKTDKESNTSLHYACLNGYYSVADFLISNNADINAENTFGDTPLHYVSCLGAIQKDSVAGQTRECLGGLDKLTIDHKSEFDKIRLNEYFDIASDLVLKGAIIDPIDNNGSTPLHNSCISGAFDIANLLLEKGANVEAKGNRFGRTPLHCAVCNRQVKIVRLLIQLNAKVDSIDSLIHTSLHYSCAMGDLEITTILTDKNADVNAKARFNITPLYYASGRGHGEIAKILVAKGACKKITEKRSGNTPLHNAAINGHVEIVEILAERPLKSGESGSFYGFFVEPVFKKITGRYSSVERKDNNGNTPLHLACSYGHIDVVCVLLRERSDTNVKDSKNGFSPLHYAVSMGHSDIVDLLIRIETDTEIRDKYGRTPLHISVNEKNITIIRSLLKCKANIDARDSWNRTPLSYACESGSTNIVRLLVGKGADITIAESRNCYTALIKVCKSGDIGSFGVLVRAGADVNKSDNYGETPLHHACRCGNTDIVRSLIERRADIGAVSIYGKTPEDVTKSSSIIKVLNNTKQLSDSNPMADALSTGNKVTN